jgi:hypothetical protein
MDRKHEDMTAMEEEVSPYLSDRPSAVDLSLSLLFMRSWGSSSKG